MCGKTDEIEISERTERRMREAFADWFAENDYLWAVGVPLDVASLRSRLNAAAANSCSS